MSEYSEDQIHPATPARRKQAVQDGDFAKSFELSAAVQMLGAMAVAFLTFGQLASWLRQSTSELWTSTRPLVKSSPEEVAQQLSTLIFSALTVLAPIGLLLVGVGVASHWCQTGPVFVTKKVSPDPLRLAPANWFSRLFSLGTWSLPVVGLPKALLATGVMVVSCYVNRDQFLMLGLYPADQMVEQLFLLVLKVCTHVAVMLFLASLLDYGMKYFFHQQKLRMTDQQLRDELRMENGNPAVSAHRRRTRNQPAQ